MTSKSLRYPKLISVGENHESAPLVKYSISLKMAVPPSSTSYGHWTSPPKLHGEDEMDTTFTQLQETHQTRLTTERGEVPIQVLRNHQSVLNSYLVFCGKTLENRIGREFVADFLEKTEKFTSAVCKNKKAASDKMSILRAWKVSVDLLIKNSRRQPATGESLFHKELRAAVAKMNESHNSISRKIGLAPYSLCKWINGAFPAFRGMPGLRRLESYLNLERGHLENLLPHAQGKVKIKSTLSSDDKYIARHAINTKQFYRMPIGELSAEFINEWALYLKYKTAEYPGELKRTTKGRWRVLPIEKIPKKERNNPLIQTSVGYGCMSASRTLKTIRSYLGFLTLPPSKNPALDGLNLKKTEIQTLAIFAIPEHVNSFLEFMKSRSGNVTHNGHVTAAAFISSLCRPNEGYLWQQPSLLNNIEKFAKGRTWEQLCAKTMNVCAAWEQSGKGTKSRDPSIPIRGLMKLDDPLEPFKRAINQLDMAAASSSPGGVHQAIHKRDALILAMTISNPLRLRTMSLMKYVDPFTSSGYETNLYKAENGIWRLRFGQDDFKNGKSKKESYDAPLPAGLGGRIEEYLLEYRPVLIRHQPEAPWVFPNTQGEELGDLGERISKAAKKYIPEVTRLRPHAIRNIVASDYLRRNPGQYAFVAELLHDTLETVLKHYANNQLEPAFKAYEKHLTSFFEE